MFRMFFSLKALFIFTVCSVSVKRRSSAVMVMSYHDASRGAKIQLNDEAVPPGQEGSSSGRDEHVGIRGGSGIITPSFR